MTLHVPKSYQCIECNLPFTISSDSFTGQPFMKCEKCGGLAERIDHKYLSDKTKAEELREANKFHLAIELENEYQELQERTKKLERFIIDSDDHEKLSRREKSHLSIQLGHMIGYGQILKERLNAFPKIKKFRP